MKIKVSTIPRGYHIKRWGHLGNRELWWNNSGSAYREIRTLLKYNPRAPSGKWLVYYDKRRGYTLLEKG